MSTLTVQNIQGSSSSGNTINVASGHTLHQPGMIIQTQVGQFQEGIGGHTRVETTSQTPVATNILVTITPKLSTSKILINFSGQGAFNSGSAGNAMELYLYRSVGGASFAAADLDGGKVTNYAAYSNSSDSILHSVSFSWLDNPATTSAVIYKIYIASANGAANVKFGSNTQDLTFISAMEIAQ